MLVDPFVEKSSYTIDESLRLVGSKNRYQKLTFLYFSMQWLITYWVLGCPTYLFKSPTLVENYNQDGSFLNCRDTNSFDDVKCQEDICGYYEKNGIEKLKQYLVSESVVLQYDPPLICSNEKYRTLMEQFVYIGSFVGFFVFSYISDNHGRKVSLGTSWFLASIGAVIIGTAQNYFFISLGLFMCGFGANPAITVHYSFINEQSQGKFREFQTIGVQTFFGLGEIILVPISYYYRSWRILCLYWFSIPMMLLNLPIFFVKESPKFLMLRDREKAVQVLNEIAAINKKPQLRFSEVSFEDHTVMTKKYWPTDLLRYKYTRKPFISGFLVFFVIQYTFYGLNFSLGQLRTGFYESALTLGIFDFLCYSIIDFLIPFLPRKRTMALMFLVTSVLSLVYWLIESLTENDWVLLLMLGLIRFFITSEWSLAYTFYSESFPSAIRSLALGMISAGGTIGSMLSPLNRVILANQPMVPICLLSILGVFSALPPRETFKQQLLDEIPEENQEKH